jgi:hypothetical protein
VNANVTEESTIATAIDKIIEEGGALDEKECLLDGVADAGAAPDPCWASS